MFNQSFDSKLSEFSDNSEMMVLSRPQEICELGKREHAERMNTLGKQLQEKKRGFREESEYFEGKVQPRGDSTKMKNFTFSKNKGGKSYSNSGEDGQMKISAEISKPNKNKTKKILLEIDSSKEEENEEDKYIEEKEFKFSLPISNPRRKQPKFELDLGVVQEGPRETSQKEPFVPQPPSLGKNLKFEMGGFGKSNFGKGKNAQPRLNAPRNNNKKTFNFNSDIVNRNLRKNFKLVNNKRKFQPTLEIVIPEENSRDIEYEESDSPALELPSLKERRSRKATQVKKFDLGIEVSRKEEVPKKVVLVDDFEDCESGRGIHFKNDRTSSNSPRHVSRVNGAGNVKKIDWSQVQPTKNLEIPLDSHLINLTVGTKDDPMGLFSGCRTNPLPTTKNANLKNKCFEFGGVRKKRQMTVSLTGEEAFRQEKKKPVRNLCIDEVSNDEMHSNSGNEEKMNSLKKIQKKRNLKMKINSKNSEYTNKNFSKQSSQIINSIQSKKFFRSLIKKTFF